jgi:hypothetical protein
VLARYARLLLSTNWSSSQELGLTLGEWKVIAQPGFDPFNGNGLNIADRSLGGHVVWAKPRISVSWDESILTTVAEQPTAKVPANESLEWVVAFHNNRAAQISSVEWIDNPKPTSASIGKIEELSISASMDSPAGPWQPINDWSRSETGNTLTFSAPVWRPRHCLFTNYRQDPAIAPC